MSKIKILNDLINNYEYNNHINKNKIIDLLDYIKDLQKENNRLNLINNDLINKLKRIKHLKK
tara:strand:+ start:504 stop:689 length:186 start_codon:yes stop_codon:yes gene_type:complete